MLRSRSRTSSRPRARARPASTSATGTPRSTAATPTIRSGSSSRAASPRDPSVLVDLYDPELGGASTLAPDEVRGGVSDEATFTLTNPGGDPTRLDDLPRQHGDERQLGCLREFRPGHGRSRVGDYLLNVTDRWAVDDERRPEQRRQLLSHPDGVRPQQQRRIRCGGRREDIDRNHGQRRQHRPGVRPHVPAAQAR